MSGCRVSLWLLLAALVAAPAGACGLQAELLYTLERHDAPPAGVPVLSRTEAATATEALRVPLPRRSTGHWLRLTCRDALAPAADWLLVVEGAERIGELTFHAPGEPPRRVRPAGRAGTPAGEHLVRRGWSLALPNGWPASSVAYLHAEGASTEPMRLRLARSGELVREQRADARRTVAAAAMLLLIAVAMLAIYARFRDLLYLSYASYLVCVSTYALLLSGDAAATGVLAPFLAHGPTGQWAIATLAVTLQLVFTRRILELDRLAPAAATLLRALFWAHLGLLALLLAGRARVHGWYPTVGNGLLVASAPVVLAIAVLAWRRGAAYAVFYLAGWTPMVAVAMLVAANQLGLIAAPWADRALPLVAVVESAVLAFALSCHAANRHRVAMRARRSRDRDTVTGAPNAAALLGMLESWRQLGGLGARSYGLLLLELDDHAAFAQRHGDAVVDAVLRQVFTRLRAQLRPGDMLARLGPERFAIVSECERADAEPLARRLADAVAATPFRIDGQALVLSASVGVAMAAHDEAAPALMQRAYDALRRASGFGHNAISTGGRARPASALAQP